MPSRSGDRYHQFPLSGAVAQTLCQMAGIAPQPEGTRYGRWTWALYEAFDCVNAIERHGPWVIADAAAHLRDELETEREVVVLLGRRAQEAYAQTQAPAYSVVEDLDFYEWVVDEASPTARREVCVLPHPSGLNRVYNDPAARRVAGRILHEAIEKGQQLHETRL